MRKRHREIIRYKEKEKESQRRETRETEQQNEKNLYGASFSEPYFASPVYKSLSEEVVRRLLHTSSILVPSAQSSCVMLTSSDRKYCTTSW
jgi:hypothetical protein